MQADGAETDIESDTLSNQTASGYGWSITVPVDKDDRGGPTNFGITRGTLSSWRGREVTAAEVRAMDVTEAMAILSKNYWIPAGCERLSSLRMATALFDASVLFGVRTATESLQKALRKNGFAVATDGLMGVETIEAVNLSDSKVLLGLFQAELKGRIEAIVKRDPTQGKFEKGWLYRIDRYLILKDA